MRMRARWSRSRGARVAGNPGRGGFVGPNRVRADHRSGRGSRRGRRRVPPPATLATVTDAAAPRAADPDGPAPSLGLEGADGTFPRATAPDVESATTGAGFPDQRLAAFDASIRAMAAVLSLDRILQVIVDRVRELVGASYAALGIVDAEEIGRAHV